MSVRLYSITVVIPCLQNSEAHFCWTAFLLVIDIDNVLSGLIQLDFNYLILVTTDFLNPCVTVFISFSIILGQTSNSSYDTIVVAVIGKVNRITTDIRDAGVTTKRILKVIRFNGYLKVCTFTCFGSTILEYHIVLVKYHRDVFKRRFLQPLLADLSLCILGVNVIDEGTCWNPIRICNLILLDLKGERKNRTFCYHSISHLVQCSTGGGRSLFNLIFAKRQTADLNHVLQVPGLGNGHGENAIT